MDNRSKLRTVQAIFVAVCVMVLGAAWFGGGSHKVVQTAAQPAADSQVAVIIGNRWHEGPRPGAGDTVVTTGDAGTVVCWQDGSCVSFLVKNNGTFGLWGLDNQTTWFASASQYMQALFNFEYNPQHLAVSSVNAIYNADGLITEVACSNGVVRAAYYGVCPAETYGTPPNCKFLPTCTGGKVLQGEVCVCPVGKVLVDDKCVDSCPAGQTGIPPNCTGLPLTCTGGQIVRDGVCVCPDNQDFVGGVCVAKCSAGMVGAPPNCVTPAVCSDGSIAINGKCPAESRCNDGSVPVNGMCPGERCFDGSMPINGKCASDRCRDGSIPVNGRCPAGKCLDGSVPINGMCPTDRCSDGSVPVNGNCPAEKCADGSIPVNGMCPSGKCVDGSVPVFGKCPADTCPDGSKPINGACGSNSCPRGMTGTPPNCQAPTPGPTPTPDCENGSCVCPTGMIGTPPNCKAGPCVGSGCTTCSTGYIPTPTGCAKIECQSGYVLSGNTCVKSKCDDADYCNGNDSWHITAACEANLVTKCSGTCMNGSCLPIVVPGPASVSIKVTPSLVRKGSTTRVSWSSANTKSCSVIGSNGDSWIGIAGAQVSKPINAQTTFVATCKAKVGGTVSTSTQVILAPVYQEK